MRNLQFFVAALLLFFISAILTQLSEQISNKARYAVNVQQVLHEKKEKAQRLIAKLETADNDETLKIIKNAGKEKIYIFRYINSLLDFWSTNAITVYEEFPDSLSDSRITQIFNSFYYIHHINKDSVDYLALILIKSRYTYSNEYLQTGFDPSYKLPGSAVLDFDENKGYAVYDDDGSYLFSVEVPPGNATTFPRSVISTLFLLLGIVFMGIFGYQQISRIAEPKKRNIAILGIVVLTITVRFLQVYFNLRLDGFILFDPYVYADSALIPSMGDLAVNSLLYLFLIIYFTSFYTWNFIGYEKKPVQRHLLIVLLSILIQACFIYAHYFSNSLIFNSNINFQANEVDQLSIYSLISFLIHGINFLAATLIMIFLVRVLLQLDNPLGIFPGLFLCTIFIFAGLYLSKYPLDLISVLYFYLSGIGILVLSARKIEINNYTFLMIFVLGFSAYSLALFSNKSGEKEYKNRSTLAISLDNEHDPVAEYLFEELSQSISGDTSVINRLNNNLIDIYELYDHLQKNYFTGFWNKYDMQITLCGPSDSVLIETPDFEWYYCYGFFQSIIKEAGISLPNTHFYYLDFAAGRISYLGRFEYKTNEPPYEITLYIELDSRLAKNLLLGYPELLLDDRIRKERLIEHYSAAKYFNGNLVSQSGEFSYSLSPVLFGDYPAGFSEVNLDGYSHLIYNTKNNSLIVLSRPKTGFLDLLIAFSYLFLFYYLGMAIYLGIRKLSISETRFLQNLRSKIQFSILSILIVSLILIAASAIWLSIRSYKNNQDTILHEKIQSVLIELTHKLTYESELTPYWHAPRYDNLGQLLIKFSDVFYTDINMYDKNGNLLATSRPEVFSLGLQGEKIDPVAYFRLNTEKRAQFIQREKIGKLSYQSAYVPFENADGKLLAYLNLPYFTRQQDLQSSITALVVTVVNIYVILILVTIVITIFISDQITRPLELLQLRFRELKLGGRYDMIHYRRKDEIGKLVAEYNRMVSELEYSVDLLAKSERESAWREMAKQIAHEIKNPLTPMRLGIQQLQRAWKDGRKDFDEQLNTLAGTLIEQIDTLSSIASEFSTFAKMPAANIQDVDVVSVLQKTAGLFEGNPNYALQTNYSIETAIIRADPKQISRVFINVIKNAIQAIPEGREGRIQISVERIDKQVLVTIEDNGKGIPEEIKPKLFMPNFTTKTSGMGLGLAIVRNILEPLGAGIEFFTEVDKGTRFILHFPYSKK
jgi:signal transduction histidine kinase